MRAERTSFEALGLARNPFGELADEFFSEGDRARQLEELKHLANWSRRLLAVTGERGVGKSTLFRALAGRLDPGVKAARINANLTSDTREVLAGIIQGFGMAAPANADPKLLVELIALHAREQGDARRNCLVLIDDAHLLELRALEQILKLVDADGDDGLRIVFFAEPYFVQSLDKATRRSERGQNWHEIRLSPFTEEETRRYVAFRLKAAGLLGRSPFTPNELAVIVGGSSGLPGRIDELASSILTGELRIDDDRRVLPRMHRAIALLVLIVAGMGWLIFYNYPPKDSDGDTTEIVAVKPAVHAAGETVAIPLPQAGASDSAEPHRGAADADSPARTSSDRRVDAAEVDDVPVMPKVDEEQTASPASARLAGRPERTAPAPVASPPSVSPSVASVPHAPREPASTKPEPTPAKPSHPERAAKIAPPSEAVGASVKNEQWLRQQPGKYFTLQLFATSNRGKRDEFIRGQDHPERFATFTTKRGGEVLYAVTYGAYATQTEANAAAAALPASVGRVQPWVRTFASVQAALD